MCLWGVSNYEYTRTLMAFGEIKADYSAMCFPLKTQISQVVQLQQEDYYTGKARLNTFETTKYD